MRAQPRRGNRRARGRVSGVGGLNAIGKEDAAADAKFSLLSANLLDLVSHSTQSAAVGSASLVIDRTAF
jgi:hypothetical protein